MAFTVLKKEQQGNSQFNGGEIKEKRPVAVMEGGGLMPYSNLFYWANAKSEVESTIGEHPHQGFEILSFVLEGEIVHYDSYYQKWLPLKEGSVQIIRSGSGISHAEKFLPGTNMFQIWFDPNLQEAIQHPPSYNDYAADKLPINKEGGITIKTWIGEGSPVTMNTPGVVIKEYRLGEQEVELGLNKDVTYSAFVLKGSFNNAQLNLEKEDFLKIEGEQDSISLQGQTADNRLFVITTPAVPRYVTYASRIKHFHGSF